MNTRQAFHASDGCLHRIPGRIEQENALPEFHIRIPRTQPHRLHAPLGQGIVKFNTRLSVRPFELRQLVGGAIPIPRIRVREPLVDPI